MATPRGEALLAVTGITTALRPGPMPITLKILKKAEGLETTLRRKLRKFARGKDVSEPPEPPKWSYEEVMRLLPEAENEARQVENVSGFYDPELANEYADALGTAIGYVQSIAPMEVIPTTIAEAGIEPSGLDVSEFRRRYDAVDRPLAVLDDLAAGMIVPDQVEALKTVYPQIYSALRTMILQEMVDAGGDKADYTLPYAKDLALQTFLGTETVDPALHQELLKVFDEHREKESGKPSSQTPEQARMQQKGIGDPSTQQERLEAK